jgi:trehalose/maltose hydrolase-like predicted phosphorylase
MRQLLTCLVLGTCLMSVFLLVGVQSASTLLHDWRANKLGNPIPPDWRPRVEEGNMLFGSAEPSETYRMAAVGNGYMSSVVGSDTIYVAGVFNGAGQTTHRARIPSTNAITLTNAQHVGSALDLERAVFYRRSTYQNCLACAVFNIEQRWYTHRYYASLFVHEIEIKSLTATGETATFQIALNNGTKSVDMNLQPLTPVIRNTILIDGKTYTPEQPTSTRVEVAVCSDFVPTSISVNATGEAQTFYFITAIRTSLDSVMPVDDAIIDFQNALGMKGGLLSTHIAAWADIWEAGIEVGGRLELAQAINSSLYYLLSAIREGNYETMQNYKVGMEPRWKRTSSFPVQSFSLSPGSLATSGYNGHTFWDADVWMYPTLLMFYPSIARNVVNYRYNRIPASALRAQANGYQGYQFVWESAFTGTEVCPWPGGWREHHIMGDIAIAVQNYWRVTQDKEWLKNEGLPIVYGIAQFWASRVTWNSSLNAYAINGVVGPDEYATGDNYGGINNNAYTNAIAQATFNFVFEAMSVLDMTPPAQWKEISSKIYIPFDKNLNYHPEYQGYKRSQIVKQADTVLLGYPVLYSMPETVRANDLTYYAGVTDPNGPAMTWGMFSLGWLEIGHIEEAARYFNLSYQLNINLPFYAWMEGPNGGCPHFITGAGGFLQGVWAGYGGVRILEKSLTLDPILPENTDYVRFRRLQYSGSQLDILYTEKIVNVTLQSDTKPYLQITARNVTYPLTPGRPVVLSRDSRPFSITTANKEEDMLLF